MLHRVFGRKFSRPTGHRTSLFKNLVRQLVIYGRVTTTKQKAKAIQGMVDRLVVRAKKSGIAGLREVARVLGDKKAVSRLVNHIVPGLGDRPSGFTRIIPLGQRFSDAAEMVRLEWVVAPPETIQSKPEPLSLPKEPKLPKRPTKRLKVKPKK